MNDLISNKGVCRTAPATSGLFIMSEFLYYKQPLSEVQLTPSVSQMREYFTPHTQDCIQQGNERDLDRVSYHWTSGI